MVEGVEATSDKETPKATPTTGGVIVVIVHMIGGVVAKIGHTTGGIQARIGPIIGVGHKIGGAPLTGEVISAKWCFMSQHYRFLSVTIPV